MIAALSAAMFAAAGSAPVSEPALSAAFRRLCLDRSGAPLSSLAERDGFRPVGEFLGDPTAFLGLITPLPNPGGSMALWRNIASSDREAYLERMRQLTPEQALRDALNYNYSLATQAGRKYRRVQRSVACFRVAMLLWMGLVLLGIAWG